MSLSSVGDPLLGTGFVLSPGSVVNVAARPGAREIGNPHVGVFLVKDASRDPVGDEFEDESTNAVGLF